MPLKSFLTDPKNTKTREHMLTCRLQADLLDAASNRGYPLQIYLPTVDRDGFDIIFSDAQTLVPVQVKSTATKRSKWEIHRKFFRPRYYDFESYKLFSSSHESGMSGGVALIDIKKEQGVLSLSYAYSDYLIVRLLASGHFNYSKQRVKAAREALEDMTSNIDGSFALKRTCFLGAPTSDHLLSLMGLHSRVRSQWRHEWLDYLSAINDKNSFSTWKEKPDEYLFHILESFASIGYT